MNIRRKCGCFAVVLLVPVLVFSSCLYFLHRPAPVYETNDVADYGVIKGNYNNEKPKVFISSFFPKRIEEYFSDVTYHYKAKKLDTYAYEMYLEFVIQDTEKYTAFLSNVVGDGVCEPFYFDSAYQMHLVSNYLSLNEYPESERLAIENAKVGLVLFSDVEQRVIFCALGVYDGGGTSTDELNYFFNKFEIDPRKYEKRAIPGISS